MYIFGSLSKVDHDHDGTLRVCGWASSEAVDSDGEIVTADAIAKALPEFMTFANLREMHQPRAAGVVEDARMIDHKLWIEAKIVDPIAIKKVQTGVYKGFSIAGRVLKRAADNLKKVTALRLTEISLVDRPANPDAVFVLAKAEGTQGAAQEGDDLFAALEGARACVDELYKRSHALEAAIKAERARADEAVEAANLAKFEAKTAMDAFQHFAKGPRRIRAEAMQNARGLGMLRKASGPSLPADRLEDVAHKLLDLTEEQRARALMRITLGGLGAV